jgi:quercetin dioxygenase-like cupin family protein
MSRIGTTLAALLATTALYAQAPPAGFSRTPLFDNATVSVFRLMLQPGARETPHTHPNSMLAVWISRGEVEMLNGQQQPAGTRQTGEVEFFAREVTHAAGNGGSTPFEIVVINIKPDRAPGGTAPPAPPPAGVHQNRRTRQPGDDGDPARVCAFRARTGVHASLRPGRHPAHRLEARGPDRT